MKENPITGDPTLDRQIRKDAEKFMKEHPDVPVVDTNTGERRLAKDWLKPEADTPLLKEVWDTLIEVCEYSGDSKYTLDVEATRKLAARVHALIYAPAPLPPPQEPRCLPGAYRSDGPCKDCGMPCLPWFAPNEIWNRVVAERSGLLCPNCFISRAFTQGLDVFWKVEPVDCAEKDSLKDLRIKELEAERMEFGREAVDGA